MRSKLALLAAVAALVSAPAAASARGWSGGYLLAGAGATQFTNSPPSDLWDTGVAWSVRLGMGSRSPLGVEVAYVGAMRGASIGNNDITEHGAEGVVRLQFPYVSDDMLVEPFALAGIGWTRVSLDNPVVGDDTDDIGTVPLGAGVMVGIGRFLVDGRFVYRAAFSEDTLGDELEAWSVVGSIGWEF